MNTTQTGEKWALKTALFLASQNISLFGSSVVAFAILWHITLETSSGTWIMFSTIATALPQVLISFFGGVFADRYNRKYLIMMADGFIALATLALAVCFLLGFDDMWLLLVVLTIRSFGGGIQNPAVSAIYPQIVPESNLTQVQGINQTVSSILTLLSPAVGGIVLGRMGIVWAFMIDVVTATIAIVIMAFIKVKKHVVQAEPMTMAEDIKKGFHYAFSLPPLRNMIICYMFSFFLVTPASVLSPLMVERTFGGEVWRLTASEIVWTVGSLIGGVFVSIKGKFRNKVKTVAICIAGFGIPFALLGVYSNFIWFLTLMAVAGFFLPPMMTAQTVYIQEITDPTVLGRVFSIIQITAVSAVPLAILIFGPLADIIKVEYILMVSGVLITLVAWVYWHKSKDL